MYRSAFLKYLLMTSLLCLLVSCTTTYSPAAMSQLKQGQRDFDGGYYKHAMRELLPLACSGNADAQYAVGYMYYYGYGVAQDSDVGAFWIERSAAQHYKPAILAMEMMMCKENEKPRHKFKCHAREA